MVGIAYDAKGRRERIDYGNGTFTEYTYDSLSFRLTRLRTLRPSGGGGSGGSTVVLQDLFYFYDPVGNITTIRNDAHEDVFFGGQQVSPTQDFVYDQARRCRFRNSWLDRRNRLLGFQPIGRSSWSNCR